MDAATGAVPLLLAIERVPVRLLRRQCTDVRALRHVGPAVDVR